MKKHKSTTKAHKSMEQETVSKVLTKGGLVAGYELSSGEQVNLKKAAKMAHFRLSRIFRNVFFRKKRFFEQISSNKLIKHILIIHK